MIGAQGHHDQVRQIFIGYVLLEVSEKDIQAVLIRNASIENGKGRIDVLRHGGDISDGMEGADRDMQRTGLLAFQNQRIVVPVRPGSERLAGRADERRSVFAVHAHRQTVRQSIRPEESGRCIDQAVAPIVGVAAIEVGELLFDIIRRNGLIRPLMAVGRQDARIIEVIKQHILIGEGVVVRRNLGSELHERRITIAKRHIAKNLVIGAVFLDDINHVLDGVVLTENQWPVGFDGLATIPAVIGSDLDMVGGETTGVGQRNNGNAPDKAVGVFAARIPGIGDD